MQAVARDHRQPPGVLTLAMVEMWERFSYYGMVALLVLFLIAPEDGPWPPGPGEGFSEADAAALFGCYGALVMATPLLGGWIGDRLIGPRRALVIGGVLISAGHFILILPRMEMFWLGLLVIAAGTGLLKPNISTILGDLYPAEDPRRDSGFSMFYFGINVGAFMAPLICGWLATTYSWRLAFGIAGFGMLIGLGQYALGRRRLGQAGLQVPRALPVASRLPALGTALAITVAVVVLFTSTTWLLGFNAAVVTATMTVLVLAIAVAAFTVLLNRTRNSPVEHRHMRAFLLIFIATAVYLTLSSQAGSTIAEFVQDFSQRTIGAFTMPTSWLQSLNPVLVIAFAPVFAWLWTVLGRRAPTTPTKTALGLSILGSSFLVMVIPGRLADEGQSSALAWILLTFLLMTWAELLIVPIALSTTTKLAPQGLSSQMVGLWYLAAATGGALGGQLSRLTEVLGRGGYFLACGLVVLVVAAAFLALRGTWTRLLAPIR
jgi:POT family proton-dependent oligopeptide transporter